MTMTCVTGVRGDIRIIRQQFVRRKENEFDIRKTNGIISPSPSPGLPCYERDVCYHFLVVLVLVPVRHSTLLFTNKCYKITHGILTWFWLQLAATEAPRTQRGSMEELETWKPGN